ncbi:MAG TPA: DUF3574 domain-containing protein [Kamptonema sp.]|nr:DUF3574 domain-containing protein [Kamptonema sp.]
MPQSKVSRIGFLALLSLGLTVVTPAVANKPVLQSQLRTTEPDVNNPTLRDTANFIQEQLFFGLSIPGGGMVTEEQWQTFLNEVVTPRFPKGLTVISANGQYLESSGNLARETSKVIYILYENSPNSQEQAKAIDEIIDEYKKRFNQESVLRVTIPIRARFE